MHFCLSVSEENGLTPVQMTMALEKQEPNFTEAQEQREMWGATKSHITSPPQRTGMNEWLKDAKFAFI